MKSIESQKEAQKKFIPPAACGKCGGWTSYGGMSQYSNSYTPVSGRTGCNCHSDNTIDGNDSKQVYGPRF